MDNASFHKGEAMKLYIASAGQTLLYLPIYSPDLNAIEHTWAKLKHIRRKLGCSVIDLFKYHVS